MGKKAQPKKTVEIEQKYDLPAGFTLPELSGLPGEVIVGPAEVRRLDAVYFDTGDLRLLAARHTLRRRTGGPDEGWHLKEPGDGASARTEVTLPLGRSVRTVPPVLRDAVAVHSRGRDLVQVARLATTRTVYPVRAADGSLLAELMLDQVDALAFARATGGGATDGTGEVASSWAELEVELVGAGPALVAAIAERLAHAGARPSADASKLARALGRPSGGATEPSPGDRPELGAAARAMLGYLAAEIAHLKIHDPLVRADAPDAVHQLRVACRRLRSALATYRPLLDRSVTDPIRDELRWIGGELGAARDAEVIRDHLLDAVKAEPASLRRGPVVGRVRTTMNARYRQAHDLGLTELRSPRYFALLDTLDALVADPPLAEGAVGRGRKALRGFLRRSWRRISREVTRLEALDAASAAGGPSQASGGRQVGQHDERDLLLHEIRKAAKRARYAGESMGEVFGEPALQYAAQMARIQSVLGEHQDSVVIRDELIALAAAAEAAQEPTFTYGRLHAAEQARGERTADDFRLAWSAADDPDPIGR